jgi:hypothetical protein
MGVYELLGKSPPLVTNGRGYCIFSGARTSNRLPNGDFVSPDVAASYVKSGWLTSSLEYSDKYFADNPHLKRFVDAVNHVQAISGYEIIDAIRYHDTDVVKWFLENVPPTQEVLKEALRVAREWGAAGTRALLEKFGASGSDM